MVAWKLKLWTSAGAAVALAACGQATTTPAAEPEAPPPAAAGGEAAIGESGGEHGGPAATAYAGLSGDQLTGLRLQHLKGYVLAAERIAEGDRPADAAALVGQGLAAAFDPANAELAGLDQSAVRAAADGAELSRAQMSARLQSAAAAIDGARATLRVNHADLAVRLVDLASGLYQEGAAAGAIDSKHYQESLGAALSARDALTAGEAALRREDAAAYDEALGELNRLIALFPGVEPSASAASYQDVLRQSSRVRLALSPYL